MNTSVLEEGVRESMEEFLNKGDAFSRQDESDDGRFYAVDRFVDHLDAVALETVEKLVDTLVVEKRPAILDLMAGWDSHLPGTMEVDEVVGLGLNKNELSRNKALTEIVLHDLNRDPVLPFEEDRFDVVLNTVSVDYMTGNASMSYRQMYNPENGSLTPMPVPNLKALRDGILEED